MVVPPQRQERRALGLGDERVDLVQPAREALGDDRVVRGRRGGAAGAAGSATAPSSAAVWG